MAYICLHSLTDQQKILVAQRFKRDILISGFTHQAIADKVDLAQSTIAGWSTGRLLIPIWRAFDLQKKTKGVFLVRHLRPDFVRKFAPELHTLLDYDPLFVNGEIDASLRRDHITESATEFNVRRERERGNIK